MSDATPSGPSETDSASSDVEVDAAIALCGGDVRAALRATLLANAYLEAEVERLSEAVSAGFARGRIRRRAKPEDGEQKVG
jgi:hypothetical protein